MHVTVLGMNYAPEMTGIAPYTAGLAEHLAACGHRVSVLTTCPHYPQWSVQPPYRGRWRVVERRGGVFVRRGPVLLPRRGSAVWRVAYDTSLALTTLLNAAPVPRADVVLCVSPPIQLGITAAVLARRSGAALALLVQDLPLDAALAVGLLRPGRVVALGRWLERLVYSLADRIIVISTGFRERLVEAGVPSTSIVEIPNWVDTDRVRPLPPEPALRRQLGAAPGDFLVVHTGNMGEKQGLASAVAAARGVNGAQPFTLSLIGDGSDREAIAEAVARERLANVHLLPLQPAELFPRLLAAADALLLNQRAAVVESVAPSKLLTYMAAGRPVLAAVNPASEAARVVRGAECGVLVEPEQPAALARAVAALAADPARRDRLGANGRRYVETHYTREAVLARYERCLEELAAARERRRG